VSSIGSINLDEALIAALEGKAVLFAGSGFSYGAKNYSNNNIVNGKHLKEIIASSCDSTLDVSGYDLSTLADYFIDQKSQDALIELLLRQFKVLKIAPYHETIMSIPWKRVYTTNYDDVIEIAASKNGIDLQTVTLADNLDNYPKDKVCVHINGSIHKLNRETLNKEFKLTDKSYDSEILRGKPWFDFMETDFRSAKAIIIMGFSMQYDLDIRRLIAVPAISSKVIFITKQKLAAIEKSVFNKYATAEEIGVDGFAEKVKDFKQNFIPEKINATFVSFIHEHMTPYKGDEISFPELINFYYHGNISDKYFFQNGFGEYQYVINRRACDEFIVKMMNYKVFLVVSNLGNGKTVLCNLVRNDLRNQDIHVFSYTNDCPDIDEEIAYMTSKYTSKKIIVIIDDYYKHFDLLNRFKQYGTKNIIFVLTSRLSRNTTSFRKLATTLEIKDDEIYPLFLNKLQESEIRNLANIFFENKLLPQKVGTFDIDGIISYLTTDCHSSLSEIVLNLFESSYIKKELVQLFEECINEKTIEIKHLSIASLAASTMNFELKFSDLLNLLNINYIALKLNESTLINELFDVTSDTINIKSSIISKYFLYNIVPPESLFEVLTKIVVAADSTTSVNSRNKEIIKAILSHSNYIFYTHNRIGRDATLKFYNGIRNTFFCKNNHFFWEQFASVCIDSEEYDSAKQCLETALLLTKKIPGFEPFQIKTIYANYLLSELKNKLALSDFGHDSIIDIIKESEKMLSEYYDNPENNHAYVFRTWNIAIEIINNEISNFDKRELSILIETLIKMKRKYDIFAVTSESRFYNQTKEWGVNQNECVSLLKVSLSESLKKSKS